MFPLLKYDSTGSSSGASPAYSRSTAAFDGSDEPGNVRRPISSALKAGWICFGFGLALSWFFPFGHAFLSVAVITAVVAMCTHQVNRGLALLISSFVASGLSALIFFTLVLGTIGMAAAPAIRQADADLRKMQAAQTAALNQITQTTTQLQSNLSTTVRRRCLDHPRARPALHSAGIKPSIGIGSTSLPWRSSGKWTLRKRPISGSAPRTFTKPSVNAIAKTREEQRQRLQRSVDWWNHHVKDARVRGADFRWHEHQRNEAWTRKQEFERQ